MYRFGLVFVFLTLGAGVCVAQLQPVASGPSAQKPAADGTYFVGPQVTTPQLVRVMAARRNVEVSFPM